MGGQQNELIFETVHGSRAYGLATAGSDTDLRGVFVPSADALCGYLPVAEQLEAGPERVHYEVRKFFRLAAACNPTAIEILFTESTDHVSVTDAGRLLLQHRSEFLSRRAGESFGRYGLAQLRRIRTHRRWLLSPPVAQPQRATFGLPERSTLSADERGAAEALLRRETPETVVALPTHVMEALDRERRYRGALREWEQYQEWTRRRNPVRAELERLHGYDTKHAMHLLRLLRMAVEILAKGEVRVRRPDAEELLAVRRGALSFDALLEQAESLGTRIGEMTSASSLPFQPDETRLNRLCVEVVTLAQAQANGR